MIADLHSHYAMHLLPAEAPSTYDRMRQGVGSRRRDRLRAKIVGLLGRFANYRSFSSGPRVEVGSLREGGVGVVLSALYSPFDEMDLSRPYGAPPQPGYANALIRQLETVEADLAGKHAGTTAVVRDAAELDAALAAGRIAFVHCVEGGFHLGGTPETVDRSVAELARRGVAYITLAHLFWRQVATNTPAIPFLPEWLYHLVFSQPKKGLTELGRAAIAAMHRERVLVDLSHMTDRALDESLALLDELDPAREVPVIASHAGYRFGKQEYNLSEAAIGRIAARDGVIGLIFANHQILDGLETKPKSLADSVAVLRRHIDRIAELTGSHRHVAIGSDLDGFVKPTLPGLQSMADMKPLEAALVEAYGPADAASICSENILRPLRSYWGA
jgi:microsomal dipeptidase-like Zn-dependent dipeptidase